jgi:glycerate kinase
MKVLIAPDKFKGSLSAAQVAHHLGRAVVEVANTCGLHTPPGPPAPLTSSSAGPGDAVRAALGTIFRDKAGHALTLDGGSLDRIHTVDTSGYPT